MRSVRCRRIWVRLATVALLVAAGCGFEDQANAPAGGPPPPGGGGSNPEIKAIMGKVAKGPNSLTPLIGKELATEPAPWDTIQPQAKEFAQLAAEMTKLEPKKGSKESWASLTAAYSKSADDLDKGAQAKDLAAAKVAHEVLSKSCQSCHQQHRGGPGMAGPGGPGMGGPGGPGPGGSIGGGPGGPPSK